MMRRIGLFLMIILVCVVTPCFAAKQSTESQAIWSYGEEIRNIADPATENMLLMLNEGNYSQYSRNFSPQMKAAVPESKFRELNAMIQDTYGTYRSKEFVSIEIRENYIMVSYKGTFSQEKEPLLIRSVFTQENGKTYISGFWLNPLKLVGNIGNIK
ncbi:Protein of unknown function [Pelosinus propionicus DSM 13327]|uniref:DUF3887 domain-containing protein n=2 Tax=Pelosinus TaxID=365348 RepID=A0A1I4NKI8_9FIRM|nr:Protein of unknown function [Pelosinus propionicus DSM 13327]